VIARCLVTCSGTGRIPSDVRPNSGRKLLPHWQKKTPILRQTLYGHRPVFGRSPEDVRTESVHVTELCFRWGELGGTKKIHQAIPMPDNGRAMWLGKKDFPFSQNNVWSWVQGFRPMPEVQVFHDKIAPFLLLSYVEKWFQITVFRFFKMFNLHLSVLIRLWREIDWPSCPTQPYRVWTSSLSLLRNAHKRRDTLVCYFTEQFTTFFAIGPGFVYCFANVGPSVRPSVYPSLRR